MKPGRMEPALVAPDAVPIVAARQSCLGVAVATARRARSAGRVTIWFTKRLGRLLLYALAAGALVLCLGAAVLWVRGRVACDEIYFNVRSHLVIAGSFPNHLDFIVYRDANYLGPLIAVRLHDKRVTPMPVFWTFRLSGDPHEWEVAIPWWLVLIFGLAVPIVVAARMARRFRWLRDGRCASCGYDLRATPGVCPECGADSGRSEYAR